MEWEINNTRTLPTIILKKNNKNIYFHSKYDPIKEAKSWVDHIAIQSDAQEIIVIGMGLGYHISILAERYTNITFLVFEFNYNFAKWLLNNEYITKIVENKNVIFNYSENISDLLKELSDHIDESTDNLLLYKPSLELIEDEKIKLSLQTFFLKKRTVHEQKESLIQNFYLNLKLKDPNINGFLGTYLDCSIILVSAGPSLTKQIPLLKFASMNDIKIVCVGTALLPLLNAGVIPDMIMISDPKDQIIEQFQGIDNIKVPLFYLSTANHSTVKHHQGKRYIVFQRGLEEAEKTAEKNKVPLIDTGGSVATTLLDLVVQFGAKKIALVGQDLAFTNNSTHAFGAHASRTYYKLINTIEVDEYYKNGKVVTSRNLYSYLKWFERYVEHHHGIQFWNCTEGGAHIKGWIHRPLHHFLNKVK